MLCPFICFQPRLLYVSLILKLNTLQIHSNEFFTSLSIHISECVLLLESTGGVKSVAFMRQGWTRTWFQADFKTHHVFKSFMLCYAAKALWGFIWSSDSRHCSSTGMQSKALQHMEELLAWRCNFWHFWYCAALQFEIWALSKQQAPAQTWFCASLSSSCSVRTADSGGPIYAIFMWRRPECEEQQPGCIVFLV